MSKLNKQAQNKFKRDRKMYERFHQLYNTEKLRLDYVWCILEDEYNISLDQIQRRLREYTEKIEAEEKKQQLITFPTHA